MSQFRKAERLSNRWVTYMNPFCLTNHVTLSYFLFLRSTLIKLEEVRSIGGMEETNMVASHGD